MHQIVKCQGQNTDILVDTIEDLKDVEFSLSPLRWGRSWRLWAPSVPPRCPGTPWTTRGTSSHPHPWSPSHNSFKLFRSCTTTLFVDAKRNLLKEYEKSGCFCWVLPCVSPWINKVHFTDCSIAPKHTVTKSAAQKVSSCTFFSPGSEILLLTRPYCFLFKSVPFPLH